MMKNELDKKMTIISIAVFISLLILPTMIWLLLKGMDTINPSIMETLDYDLGENRNKAEFPSEFDASYTAGVEAYYNDRLPFRSVIISANRKLVSGVEAPYNDVISPWFAQIIYRNEMQQQEKVMVYADEESNVSAAANSGLSTSDLESREKNAETLEAENGLEYKETLKTKGKPEVEEKLQAEGPNDIEASQGTETQVQVSTDFLPPKVHNDATIEGREKWLFFAKENSLEDYLGNNILSEAQMRAYLNALNELQKICVSQRKQLYFIILPNKEQIYSEYMPSYKIENEYKRAEQLVDYICAKSDVKLLYPKKELLNAKGNWQIYYKNDTHWNSAGAFVGVQALYQEMGIPTTKLSSLSVKPREGTAQDLVTLGNLDAANYQGDIEYTINYKPEITVTTELGDKFSDAIYSSVSSSSNRCNLVLVGDSFRVSMSKFLVKDFSNCFIVHKTNLYEPICSEKIKNADTIVIETVERGDFDLPNMTMNVIDILTN